MTTAPQFEILHPLTVLYAAAGHELPDFDVIDSNELPAPAYRLLAHSGDMTSKLEEYFADDMRLRILQCEHAPEHYRREVLLYGANSGLSVEYGAIEIHLSAFPETIRAEIVAGQVPLGGLLNRHGIRYRSEPRAFLRIAPCERLKELFQLLRPSVLFGRANRLLNGDGTELARIVEILRPV